MSAYFLTGCKISSTLPISPFLASRRLANHPPSLENPMFIIACTATCIFGSGWVTVAGSEAASIPGADGVGAVAVEKVGIVVVGGADDCAAGGGDIVQLDLKLNPKLGLDHHPTTT